MSESVQRLQDAAAKVNKAADKVHSFVNMHRKYIPIAIAVVAVAFVAYGLLTDGHVHMHSHDVAGGGK